MSKEGKKGHGNLTLYIIISIVLAILTALILPALMGAEKEQTTLSIFEGIGIGGEVFLRALMMMVVPLVVASVMNGILGLGDVRKLGKPGATAVGYYLATTVLAVTIGLIVVNIFNPGASNGSPAAPEQVVAQDTSEKDHESATGHAGLETEEAAEHDGEVVVTRKDVQKVLGILHVQTGLSEGELAKIFPGLSAGLEEEEPGIGMILGNLILMLFADNLFEAAATMNLLPLIVFAIIFAGMLTTMGEKVEAITEMVGQINDAMMSFVMLLMNIAPIGIFCLIAANFGEANAKGELGQVIAQSGMFVLTVLVGLGFHAFVTLALIYWLVTKKNPYVYMKQMSEALLTAFSTASSSATLPLTMECANKAGVSKKSTNFVLPLGATINMDGTALYEAAAAIFIANIAVASGSFDVAPLTFTDQLIVAVTATLAAIGAAGIPEAGLVTMMIVLNAVNLPVELISSVLAIDWLLDRFRTATNTFGDSIGAAIVDKQFQQSETGSEDAPPPSVESAAEPATS